MKYAVKFIVVMAIAAFMPWMRPVDVAWADGMRFASPDDAVQALIKAVKSPDPAAELVRLLGDKSKDLAVSADPQTQRENVRLFLEAFEESHNLRAVKLGGKDAYELEVGKEHYVMPLPITTAEVKEGAPAWRFDVAAAYDELLTRRIGRNELGAIQVCLAFVDAQREYYLLNPQGGRPGFAGKVSSAQGKKDGLYWPVAEGEAPSPLGERFAYAAELEARQQEKARKTPYHGYYYRMLPGQGAEAPGGAFSYSGKDGSVAGFALLAYPAVYGRSGIMSFMVNQSGEVYEKNLGPKSSEQALKIKLFDPDDSWRKVDPESLNPVGE